MLFNNLNNNVGSATSLDDGALLAISYDVGSLDGRRLEEFRVWAMRSTAGGQAFGPALFVNENPGGDQVDVSTDAGGKLFAVWDVVRGPRASWGVFWASSDDGGRRWSAAVGGERQQHVPTVATHPDGTVAALWVDYRNDPRGECSQLFFRASRDSGRCWLPAERMSAKPSCPRSPSNGER